MLPTMRMGFVMRIAKTENISNDQILAEESGFYVCLLIGNFPHHLPYLSSSLCLNSSAKLSFTTDYAPPSLISTADSHSLIFNKTLSNFFITFTLQSIIIIEQSEQFWVSDNFGGLKVRLDKIRRGRYFCIFYCWELCLNLGTVHNQHRILLGEGEMGVGQQGCSLTF